MSFPTLVGSSVVTGYGSPGTSFSVDLPANIEAGETLLMTVGVRYGSDLVLTFPNGWTEFARESRFSTSGGHSIFEVWRKADGSEGASITINSNIDLSTAVIVGVTRIAGAADPTITPPEAAMRNASSSTVIFNELTPTGGAKDYLWFATASFQSVSLSTTDPNYTALDGASQASVRFHRYTRSLNVAAEKSGDWTLSDSSIWVSSMVAIHPDEATDPEPTGHSFTIHRPVGV